jgi:molybdate transport system ATP-binding protein
MRETAASNLPAKPILSMEGVSLQLKDGRSFEPIDWQILSDQHWAVAGPNGSGKSTLMKAVMGHVPVAEGKVAYHFVQNGSLPQDHIACLAFDSQRLVSGHERLFHQARWNSGWNLDTLSVSEYLSERHVRQINPFQVLGGRLECADYAARKKRIVALLDIELLLERSMHQVSNGERRKVMLARALLKMPQLLILDNPFTGLDAGFRSRLTDIIGELMQDEMRIILVTNGRHEIPPGITHVLVVDNGRIIAQGPREVVLGRIPACEAGEPGLPVVQRSPLAEERVSEGSEEREAEGQILVRMDKVSVCYGGIQVLKQIDWTIRRGESWALLGPNGAGKTTLLSMMLADNPQAYANEIVLFGKRRGSGESIWEVKRRIGWVAPELHLYYPRHVACFDVVCSGFFASVGRYHRCSRQQRKTAMRWMQRLGLEQLADRALGEVSEGEQRMILIARGLVKNPELFVLDEPCQGLDVTNRDRVLATIEALGNRPDMSVIYVTHHLDALPRTVTHVLRLAEGAVVSRTRVDNHALLPPSGAKSTVSGRVHYG